MIRSFRNLKKLSSIEKDILNYEKIKLSRELEKIKTKKFIIFFLAFCGFSEVSYKIGLIKGRF